MLVEIERTWKSDRSTNLMSIENAIGNLLHNGIFEGKVPSRATLHARLMAGEIFETPLAEYKIKW